MPTGVAKFRHAVVEKLERDKDKLTALGQELFWKSLLLDSRVVDVPMSYNALVVTLLSWNTLFCKGLINGLRFSDAVGVEDPGIQ